MTCRTRELRVVRLLRLATADVPARRADPQIEVGPALLARVAERLVHLPVEVRAGGAVGHAPRMVRAARAVEAPQYFLRSGSPPSRCSSASVESSSVTSGSPCGAALRRMISSIGSISRAS